MANFISRLRYKLAQPRAASLFLWTTTLFVIIITFLAAYLKIRSAPQTLALHYNVIVGVDVLGSRTKLYQVPLTSVVIAIVNFLLIRSLRLRQNFLPVMLAATSLVASVIILVGMLFLYGVN